MLLSDGGANCDNAETLGLRGALLERINEIYQKNNDKDQNKEIYRLKERENSYYFELHYTRDKETPIFSKSS